MVTEIRAVVLGFALFAVPACRSQAQWNASPMTSQILPQAVHRQAIRNVAQGFNSIGSHAADLRRILTPADAEAFDAVMLDVMAGLIALPCFSLANSGDPALIRPPKPRYDRVPQIGPDLTALERFLARLQRSTPSAADAKTFARARTEVKRMLAGLPELLPAVSAKDLAREGQR